MSDPLDPERVDFDEVHGETHAPETVIFLGAGASKADGAPLQFDLFREYFQSQAIQGSVDHEMKVGRGQALNIKFTDRHGFPSSHFALRASVVAAGFVLTSLQDKSSRRRPTVTDQHPIRQRRTQFPSERRTATATATTTDQQPTANKKRPIPKGTAQAADGDGGQINIQSARGGPNSQGNGASGGRRRRTDQHPTANKKRPISKGTATATADRSTANSQQETPNFQGNGGPCVALRAMQDRRR